MRRRSSSPERRRAWKRAVLSVALLLLAAAPMPAQESRITDACAGSAPCLRAAQTALILHGSVPLAAAGGNPIPGTASTQGLRLGTLPRLSASLRYQGTRVTTPASLFFGETGTRTTVLSAFVFDGAIGISPGFSPVLTVGGVASLDGVVSAGLAVPHSRYDDGTPFSWGVGFRLGLVRESITMPGASITGMWRGSGRMTHGDPDGLETDGHAMTSASGPSLRATLGKRFFGVGLLGGVGYDRWAGELVWRAPGGGDHRLNRQASARRVAFANLSWTTLVLHLVLEAGWQSGPDLLPGLDEAAAGRDPARGNLFGGASFRLSI